LAEIYLQALRVIDKASFLREAKLLYLALDKKSKTGWDSVLPMLIYEVMLYVPRATLQLHEPLSSGGFREVRSHCTQRAFMEVPSSCASCKICCQGQITQRRMPDLWQKDSNAIQYADKEVRRSSTELTDEGPQGDPIH
jgi:hypothetical protein